MILACLFECGVLHVKFSYRSHYFWYQYENRFIYCKLDAKMCVANWWKINECDEKKGGKALHIVCKACGVSTSISKKSYTKYVC